MELDIIKNKINKVAIERNIDVQSAWDLFFFDEFLHRLSLSGYNTKFILKGGFYLQSIVGVDSRSTMDIDLKLVGVEMDSNKLINVINEIIDIKNDKDVRFMTVGVSDLKTETNYGGKSVKISAQFYNVKKTFSIDIGFGDVVTPAPILYEYKSTIFENNFIILSYSIETCIAEKFETIISKGVNNSRSKDFLDLYLYGKQQYDVELLNAAFVNTFNLRNTLYEECFIRETLNLVFDSLRIQKLYENYQNKHPFASKVSLNMCRNAIYEIFANLKFNKRIELSNYGIELHLVRHGQDELNKLGGWSDNHLTGEGKQQIIELLNKIDSDYDLFVSSDLVRAKETSEIINKKLNMEIIYNHLFREINNGKLKNLTKSEFETKYPGLYFSSLKMNESYPQGESPISFYKRVEEEFYKLIETHKNKKILLVTHGGVITIILCLVQGYVYSNQLKIIPENGTIIKLK